MRQKYASVTRLRDASRELEKRFPGRRPEVVVVLGSGMGAFADSLEEPDGAPYSHFTDFPVSAVSGHAGRLVMGRLAGVEVAVLQGRVHYYEGYSPGQIVWPLQTLMWHGTKFVILTCAVGVTHKNITPPALVLITDHLNNTGVSPLFGPNDERIGPRFPDMTDAYDPQLREIALGSARELGINVFQGIYACNSGPEYETPATTCFCRMQGADMVGMSTVFETTAARHMGRRVLGIACATNLAAGVSDSKPNHEEVKAAAAAVHGDLGRLLTAIITNLPEG